ncbi:MAG TPA: pyridoxal phosphate-dependent aminotransferase, partial [bacterium]|jgi:aspartate aminotransferase|nr:pyridoxal phosphate-dependent aminotransferase [bacterium]
MGAWAPMAEQKATARYLLRSADIDRYLFQFKSELEERLTRIYEGFMEMKDDGLAVDAVAPQAAIYLAVRFNLVGQKTPAGKTLENQEAVTAYILGAAGLAVVPFYAFGAGRNSSWYRLSVGTCIKEEIPEMFDSLRRALGELRYA